MRKILLALVLLSGCDGPSTVTSDMGKWELIGQTPGIGPMNGVYKLHSDKEKATFYTTQVHGGWTISVVKD